MPIEIYQARGGAASPPGAGALAGGEMPGEGFTIEIRFIGGLSEVQKQAFRGAADRWTRAIVGDLPDVLDDNRVVIKNLVILAQGSEIDGAGEVLGQAGPTILRPRNAGPAAFLPAKGEMMFDTADLESMEQDGTLDDVIAHEMGHVIGIGTIWSEKRLLRRAGTSMPTFRGANAMREYGLLKGQGPLPVPVEEDGGQGTRDSHWNDEDLGHELMTGFIDPSENPLSRMTIASLQDLGYQVNLDAAEPYVLPAAGASAAGAGAVRLTGPETIILPDDHLV